MEFAERISYRVEGSLPSDLLGPLARLLRRRLTRVLGISPRLWKIRIGTFHQRVLIAMPKLFFQTNIAVVIMIFGFDRAFRPVGIVG
jgi:hypothetical protein